MMEKMNLDTFLYLTRGYIEYPSDVAYPIKLDIRNHDGYPINSGTRSCGWVPDYFERRKKPDPTRTLGTRTLLQYTVYGVLYTVSV